MNDKGYVTAGILLVILLFATLYLAIIYGGVLNTTKDVIETRDLTEVLVQDLNGKERMYQVLLDNPIFEGEQEYADLEREYVVETIDEEYETVEAFATEIGGAFEVNNKTPIAISITAIPEDIGLTSSYSVELINNGKDMLNGTGRLNNGSFNYTIDESEVYDEFGVNQLGEYIVSFEDVNNVNLVVEVTYNQLIKREITLTDGLFTKDLTITIENNKVGIEETKFTEGG